MPRRATPGKPGAVAPRESKRLPATAPEIQHALHYIQQQIAEGKLRPTIADLIRLLEIRQVQQPAETVATWYSPDAPDGTCPVCLRPSDPAATQRFRAILDRQRLDRQRLTEQDHP